MFTKGILSGSSGSCVLLSHSPTTVQWWADIRIEDYGLNCLSWDTLQDFLDTEDERTPQHSQPLNYTTHF
jgi:hypothetical protein